MKIRSLLVATFVLLVLIGTLYWSERRKPTDETAKASADTPPAILKLDQASITKLEFKKKDAEPIVIAKDGTGTWQITQPNPLRADQSAVSGTLSSVATLNSERLVEDKASDPKQFGLDPPAIEVKITEKDNKTQELQIGDQTPTGNAFYAMLAGDPRVFTVAGYNKTSIDKSLNDLRDKRLLPVNADKISRIELIRGNQTIEFGRNKDEWQILKPKPMRADSLQVGELARKLTDAQMDLSASDTNGKQTSVWFSSASPVAIAKVTDQSGTEELQVRKNKDVYYAKSSAVNGVYKVDTDLAQSLDKGPDDFRDKKLFDFGFTDPDKIEMHSGSKSYFLSRNGTDWWSNGKKMDAEGVQSLVSKLRDLSAGKFVDSGFTSPTIEITVTSNDGKRLEKISIAKSGNGYIAKRENDATLYQLDANSVDEMQKAADEIKSSTASGK